MKKILANLFLLTITPCLFAANTVPPNVLNLSGAYNCTGYGDKIGTFQSKILMTIDVKNSNFANGVVAYHFKEGDQEATAAYGYTGAAIANGNNIAIYFANIDPKQQDDHGVGIGFVTHDRDASGKSIIVIHKDYYEPDYAGVGGLGSEVCTKIS